MAIKKLKCCKIFITGMFPVLAPVASSISHHNWFTTRMTVDASHDNGELQLSG